MLPGWSVVLAALIYLCLLFAVAHAADGSGRRIMRGSARTTIYALAMAVYCTSWTFYGSVGFASRSGLDFLAIYLGPVLVVGLGYRLMARIVSIAKAQNITSIADFVGARYGKSERVAALVSFIAMLGSLPYIALQLKAVSASLTVFLAVTDTPELPSNVPVLGDLALVVALVLAAFAVAFGTRHIDATEHQDGLVVAIALESLIKLVTFLIGGVFVTFWMLGGFEHVHNLAAAPGPEGLAPMLERTSELGSFLTLTVLSAFAAVLLPRQFHMAIVENRDVQDVRRLAWLFPLYLVLINLFVLPIALAGEHFLTGPNIDRDMTVLLLPLQHGSAWIALLVFLGGLSAATAMVIVASVALAIMVSNHLIMPILLRGRNWLARPRRLAAGALPAETSDEPQSGDLGSQLIIIRRFTIVAVILLGYAYYRMSGEAALVAIGLLSFAAVAQIAPAFFGGMVWRRGTALGASAGLSVGLFAWAYTLLLPSLFSQDPGMAALIAEGPLGIAALRPTALFGTEMPQLMHGVVWSLGLNLASYVLGSYLRPTGALERLQANSFVGTDMAASMAQTLRLWRSSVTQDQLQATIARYLGQERTEAAFRAFQKERGSAPDGGQDADIHTIRFGEHLLASAIGAASSRLVLSLLLKRGNLTTEAAFKLLDDASAALQYNRDLLQHALDHAGQGITVFDRDLRLLCWNRAFLQLYELPPELIRVGSGLDEIVRFNAMRGSYGPGHVEELVAMRLESFAHDREPVRLRFYPSARVIEIRSNPLPDGGLVTTYTDVTETVAVEEALEARVKERTEEILHVNAALQLAKLAADEANASKTRFLAAASHDVLQPLNAARLFATALLERDRNGGGDVSLAENVNASLDGVEEILTALLEISRLDGGALKPEVTSFAIDDILSALSREFEPIAAERGLELTFVRCGLTVRSDRRLLRRALQNLISNAIKYTPSGKVLVGVRRRQGRAVVQVLDTGLGIPADKQKLIFQEFQRLDQGVRVARGLGLGLSIVERVARTLDHKLALHSTPGRGSLFELTLPITEKVQPELPAILPRPRPAVALTGLSVLVIDNEPAILDGMTRLLTAWGCEVTAVSGLAEAKRRLDAAATLPNAIIADYHLDEGDGLEAVRTLRGRLGLATPAALLTADRSLDVRYAAEDAGLLILNKPLKPAALRALLSQWRITRTAAE